MKWRHGRKRSAFTLIEIIVVMATSSALAAVIFGSHIYGLKMSSRVQIKLNASDDARETISKLLQDIRSAHHLRIGTGSLNSFTDAPDNANQSGNALQIYSTANTNDWIRYYYSASDNSLRRTADELTSSLVTANSVTNDVIIFSEEDYLGRTFTNRIPVAVVKVSLSFTKLKNPQVPIGPGNYFDFYQIETKITPRVSL